MKYFDARIMMIALIGAGLVALPLQADTADAEPSSAQPSSSGLATQTRYEEVQNQLQSLKQEAQSARTLWQQDVSKYGTESPESKSAYQNLLEARTAYRSQASIVRQERLRMRNERAFGERGNAGRARQGERFQHH